MTNTVAEAQSDEGSRVTPATLRAPSAGMPDLLERDFFFQSWSDVIGPSSMSATTPTESWLRAFGSQTKWLSGDGWTWWIERFQPPQNVDTHVAQNCLALVIGILEGRSPRGQAVRYAGEIYRYFENRSN